MGSTGSSPQCCRAQVKRVRRKGLQKEKVQAPLPKHPRAQGTRLGQWLSAEACSWHQALGQLWPFSICHGPRWSRGMMEKLRSCKPNKLPMFVLHGPRLPWSSGVLPRLGAEPLSPLACVQTFKAWPMKTFLRPSQGQAKGEPEL